MKKLFVLSLAVVFILLTACYGDRVGMVGKLEAKKTGYYAVSYSNFTGTNTTYITIDKQKSLGISVMTNLGNLDIEIFSTDDLGKEHSLFYGDDLKTGDSAIVLDPGSYTIKAYGRKHNGMYALSYI